ncbi:hypothetical protein WOLCODRAFT_144465 [Wolfiporia cocos MD-104 SS10]|uniref:Uncharacterized protein n=1 Tax=Wolfiporia cocos (strain MD-104) TaxID=742152 RepID=A0A2H3JZI5_WOLCO|nr:hypothetical protein WOLCODRAFT_144465 [Wolfiporia cocos MD-104 SS10]
MPYVDACVARLHPKLKSSASVARCGPDTSFSGYTAEMPALSTNFPAMKAIALLEAVQLFEIIDSFLNLSNNTALEKLWICLSPAPSASQPNQYHYHWIPRFLSHVAPDALQEVSLELGSFYGCEGYSLVLSGILEDCCSIDSMLSHPAFTRLKHVYFNLPAYYNWSFSDGEVEPLRSLWNRSLSHWYPNLSCQNILRARVKASWFPRDVGDWTAIDWEEEATLL